MKKPTILSLAALLSLSLISGYSFAKTEVSFDSPEQFIDFRSRNVLTAIDENRLTSDLTTNIETLIKKTLPDNQNIHITFTDIDMAGKVFPGVNEIRTFNNNTDRTMLIFNYEITDENGKSIKEGQEKLVNLYVSNNMSREARKFRNSTFFKYELVLFSRWLKKL